MALINCPECDGMVSTQASSCPHCGCPITQISDTNWFVFKNKDISEIMDCLEKGKMVSAGVSAHSLFPEENHKQIECEIWDHFRAFKESKLPNLCPSPTVLSFSYNGKSYDVSRSVWHIDKSGNLKSAIKELFFAFDYGNVKDLQEETYRLATIVNDIQENVRRFKAENGSISYPRWFIQWEKDIDELAQQNTPKCPTCGSTNIKQLNALHRGVSFGLFGIASKTARSQFVCNKCGHKW